MLWVLTSTFQMGCDPHNNAGLECTLERMPLHTVILDAFMIDRYETTNAEYADCVNAAVCTPPGVYRSWTRESYYNEPAYAGYPVIYVDWSQAQQYCAWQGKRLPTEAEWERAARGSLDTRPFPWGAAQPDCFLANIGLGLGAYCIEDTSPVASYPEGASVTTLLNVVGNVGEWVSDYYQEDYYLNSPEHNPTGPASGTDRAFRGGSWYYTWEFNMVSSRAYAPPDSGYPNVGIRCAYSP